MAVQSSYWPLYRYNPLREAEGENPFILDSKNPSVSLEDFAYNETRYRMLLQSNQAQAESLMRSAKEDVKARWHLYREMSTSSRQNGNETKDEKK